MIFPEAMESLEMYQAFVDAVKVPVLANITEFGKTPLFTRDQLGSVGVSMMLYPLSAFRAGAKAQLNVYEHIAREGTQQNVLDTMQTRMELYDHLGYHVYVLATQSPDVEKTKPILYGTALVLLLLTFLLNVVAVVLRSRTRGKLKPAL